MISRVGNTDRVFAAVLQPDGKIVLGGQSRTTRNYPDFALARFNPDGSLDTSFGVGGIVTTHLVGAGAQDEIHALLLQPDGKIVAVGQSLTTGGGYIATGVVRYLPNGTLDSSFGTSGQRLVDAAVDQAAVLQPDGKIVCGGGGGDSSLSNFQVTRLDPEGVVDPGFGGGATVEIDFNSSADGVFGLALQPDGKIVAVGKSRSGVQGDNTLQNFAAARLLPSGDLDATFGAAGKVTTDFALLDDAAFAVALQRDGKLVLAGQVRTQGNDYDFGLLRYNANGTLDTSFGVGGKTTASFGGIDSSFAVKLQEDGKIVTAGTAAVGTGTAFGVLRHNPDGTPDSSFGSGGKIFTGFNGTDNARALLIQPDGRIVAAGTAKGGASIGDFALARYLGNLNVTTAVSRKMHNGDAFDIDLPFAGASGVECRDARGNLSLVYTFNAPVVSGTATVEAGAASMVHDATMSGNTITVDLADVADAQTLAVRLNSVSDGLGRIAAAATANVRILLGDVTGNRIVNASDVGFAKSQSGLAADAGNFRADATMNGAINATDIGLVKSRSGATVPALASERIAR